MLLGCGYSCLVECEIKKYLFKERCSLSLKVKDEGETGCFHWFMACLSLLLLNLNHVFDIGSVHNHNNVTKGTK
jgi:hypothetical protein